MRRHPDGRVIVAAFDELEVLGTYAPNNGSTEESFARRRQWDAAVGAFLHGADASRPVMWLGDLNVRRLCRAMRVLSPLLAHSFVALSLAAGRRGVGGRRPITAVVPRAEWPERRA